MSKVSGAEIGTKKQFGGLLISLKEERYMGRRGPIDLAQV